MSVTLRRLAPPDCSAARALAIAVLGDAPYAGPMLVALESAIARSTAEYQAIVARDDGAVRGVVVFGETAGTQGAGRLHLIAVDASSRRRGIGTALVVAACARLIQDGARFALIELPADPQLGGARGLARETGFREEGQMDDYVRDEVALLLLRRDFP